MSSQSSGDHTRDDPTPSDSATARPQHLPSHTPLSALGSLVAPAHGTGSYKALSKTLSRPVGASPALCAAQQLSTLHSTARLSSAMEGGKPALTSSINVPQSVSTAPSSILQIGGTSTSLGAVVPISSILRGTGAGATPFPAHLPKGAAAAANVLASPKSAITTAVPVLRQHVPVHQPPTSTHSAGHTSLPRGQIITPNIRPATPPQTISPSVTVGISALSAQLSDSHRMGIAMQTTSGSSTTPSIQITLQASRSSSDPASKHVLSQPTTPKQIHIAQAQSLTNKVAMSQAAVSPLIQQIPGISATAHPKHTAVPTIVTPSLPSTGPLSISSALSSVPPQSSASSTIPIAKVPPVRQQQPSLAGHLSAAPSTGGSSESTAPQDQGSTTSSQSSSLQPLQSHPQPSLGNPPNSLFLPQRPGPVVSSSIGHSDARSDRTTGLYNPGMPYILPPEYQQIMYQQLAAAAAQAHGGISGTSFRPGILPLQATPAGIAVTSAPAVRFNQMMVQQVAMDPLVRQQTGTVPIQTPPSSASVTLATTTDGLTRSSLSMDSLSTMSAIAASSAAIPVPALSMAVQSSSPAVSASVLYSVSSNSSHAGSLTPQHSRSETSNTPVSTPNASPRPSILRKRPNEGNVPVKKPICGLNTMDKTVAADRHSPRPDSRTDSAPQSNTSSPKTPATPAGESQSSTDTALSSEATTPTQNSMADLKIKQEPNDTLENGFPTVSSIGGSLPGSLPNSVEASPRKKPRKQLLHANEELKDNTSTDEEFDKLDEVKEEIQNEIEVKKEQRDEYVDDEGVRWTIERTKPSISLLNFYNISWKPRNNHFNRYTDVKPKEERRPTVNELSNQKGIVQKASGWKLYHMAAQLEDLTELEKSLNTTVSTIQSSLAPRPPSKHSVMEDDTGMLHELTQGNIQRCKLITDQLEEAKSSMFKVLDHKQRIFEIINKHMSKRPIKKKERT